MRTLSMLSAMEMTKPKSRSGKLLNHRSLM
jgi:hypothetical protein